MPQSCRERRSARPTAAIWLPDSLVSQWSLVLTAWKRRSAGNVDHYSELFSEPVKYWYRRRRGQRVERRQKAIQRRLNYIHRSLTLPHSICLGPYTMSNNTRNLAIANRSRSASSKAKQKLRRRLKPLCPSNNKTRGQSNLTKSASRGAHSPVRGHPRGSRFVLLNSWGRGSY